MQCTVGTRELHVTTNQNSMVDTPKVKRKEYKHHSKKRQKIITREKSKRRRNRGELQRHPNNSLKSPQRTHISIVTLDVNRIHVPMQRHRVAERRDKHPTGPSLCCPHESHFRSKDTKHLRVSGGHRHTTQTRIKSCGGDTYL